jgi:RsiW-degrading membrane proteinase PrsW (M82 family)
MASLFELFVAAVLPCLVLLWFIIRRDHYERAPFRMLLVTFVLGALSIIPAVILELFLSSILPVPADPFSDIVGLILHNLIVIAVVEESCKLIATLYAYRSREFNEPIHGIVYATTASMGFASVENVLYVLSGGWLVALFRASLSVPGHAFFGATMGFYLGRSKFDPKARPRILALAVPIGLHTIYDLIVSLGLGVLSLALAAMFILLLYRRVNREIKIVDETSPHEHRQVRFCIHCGSRLSQGWQYCPTCGGSQTNANSA